MANGRATVVAPHAFAEIIGLRSGAGQGRRNAAIILIFSGRVASGRGQKIATDGRSVGRSDGRDIHSPYQQANTRVVRQQHTRLMRTEAAMSPRPDSAAGGAAHRRIINAYRGRGRRGLMDGGRRLVDSGGAGGSIRPALGDACVTQIAASAGRTALRRHQLCASPITRAVFLRPVHSHANRLTTSA